MIAKGSFEVTMHPEPPYDAREGVSLGKVRIDKRFEGPLTATSEVNMIAARTPTNGSAGDVAIERVQGELAGRTGTFVLQHSGIMNRGARSLTVTVVPDSGTGQLKGISGRMDIQIEGGKHLYELVYEIGT